MSDPADQNRQYALEAYQIMGDLAHYVAARTDLTPEDAFRALWHMPVKWAPLILDQEGWDTITDCIARSSAPLEERLWPAIN